VLAKEVPTTNPSLSLVPQPESSSSSIGMANAPVPSLYAHPQHHWPLQGSSFPHSAGSYPWVSSAPGWGYYPAPPTQSSQVAPGSVNPILLPAMPDRGGTQIDPRLTRANEQNPGTQAVAQIPGVRPNAAASFSQERRSKSPAGTRQRSRSHSPVSTTPKRVRVSSRKAVYSHVEGAMIGHEPFRK